MKVFIITKIFGVKHYVRRTKISKAGRGVVTMVTTNKEKAFDFSTLLKATDFKNRIGIGYAIETHTA